MSKQQQVRWVVFLPLLLAMAVIFGIFIGQHLNLKSRKLFAGGRDKSSKVYDILELIENRYVDTISEDILVETAIEAIMEKLDPHSTYLPPIEQTSAEEEIRGNFEGIGIEFNIINDTIVVVRTISGGPSEEKGLRAGDRIVKINNENVAGTGVENEDVLKKLRGKKGTEVKVSLSRSGSKTLTDVTIVRDVIPIYSLDASFMVDDITGYIRVNKFSETTMEEYDKAFLVLRTQGMERLILDLRDNPGGLLDVAIDLADEYLSQSDLIVYTENRFKDRKNYRATGAGSFESNPLVVLIDEGSASASEIVAGALQDNDRAIIVGRRSFGKGLVQEPIELGDGSAIRLTVARYYTPAGRSIQKPYSEGIEKYYENALRPYDPNKDSIYQSASQQFKTLGGRVVYGGGGILPDVIVIHDTTGYTKYLLDVANKGLINDFAFDYADKNRSALSKDYKSYRNFAADRTLDTRLLEAFKTFAIAKGIIAAGDEFTVSSQELISRIKPLIARNIWKNEGYFYVYSMYDPLFLEAVEEIGK